MRDSWHGSDHRASGSFGTGQRGMSQFRDAITTLGFDLASSFGMHFTTDNGAGNYLIRHQQLIIDQPEHRLIASMQHAQVVPRGADNEVAGFVIEDHPTETEQILGRLAGLVDHLGMGDPPGAMGLFEIAAIHPAVEQDVDALPLVFHLWLRIIGLAGTQAMVEFPLQVAFPVELPCEIACGWRVDGERCLRGEKSSTLAAQTLKIRKFLEGRQELGVIHPVHELRVGDQFVSREAMPSSFW